VRGSCDPFSNLFPFACVPFFSSDRQAQVFSGNPFEEERKGGETERKQTEEREREKEGRERERAERFRARGSGRNEDGPRERTDDPALFAFY